MRRRVILSYATAFALALAATAAAQDGPKALKQLDKLEGYDQLPKEKNVEKAIEKVPKEPIEKKIVQSQAVPDSGPAPLTVQFAADQVAAGGAVYTWTFGDGSATAEGRTVKHTYTKAGTYQALLKVTGANGVLGEGELSIVVKSQP